MSFIPNQALEKEMKRFWGSWVGGSGVSVYKCSVSGGQAFVFLDRPPQTLEVSRFQGLWGPIWWGQTPVLG